MNQNSKNKGIKTVNGTTHTYTYDGSLLLCDKWGSQYIEYFYDATGKPYALRYYDGILPTKYYFTKNIEGDILELRSSTNTLAARYIYDGWGKLLEVRDASGNAITSSTHIANLNSLRYRGYFYDTETKLYISVPAEESSGTICSRIATISQ